MVNWIIVNPADQHDLVAQRLTPTFNAQFTRDVEEANGLSLFHRNGLSFPTRPVPTYLLTEHTLCTDSSPADNAWPRQPNDVLGLHQAMQNLEKYIKPLI